MAAHIPERRCLNKLGLLWASTSIVLQPSSLLRVIPSLARRTRRPRAPGEFEFVALPGELGALHVGSGEQAE